MKHTYSLMDVMMASSTEPLPEVTRTYTLSRAWHGLDALKNGAEPTKDDWMKCCDAVNIMDTLVMMGELQDTDGLIEEAVRALGAAGERNLGGKPIRLDGPGIAALTGVLRDYSEVIVQLPARTMLKAHRLTEAHCEQIRKGKGRATKDVQVSRKKKK